MSNIARDSKFKIKFNPAKSYGSYLFDDITKRHYLDFFGMYSSNPLGYNHAIFDLKEYTQKIYDYSKVKITNCEFLTEESEKFDKEFVEFCNFKHMFTNFHYCCTGSLAIEAAIKSALHYKSYRRLKVLTLNNSFHGANSFGIFVTDRLYPAAKKLTGYPENYSVKCNPDIEEIKQKLNRNDITCILIEPIRCSAGDIHLDREFFNDLRSLCDKFDVPLIFDEVQTGFCATGKIWYFEHLDIVPDIVVFGKKSQVSGIMIKKKFNKIFDSNNRTRLDVTFNSDVLDMIRCTHIIQAIKSGNLMNNTKK